MLNGGADDDILIGGTTAYDSDAGRAGLRAIQSEWTSNQSYDTRRKHLLGTLAGGLNGANKLTTSTVQADLDADVLAGGTGTDWFWGANNEITDLTLIGPVPEKVGAN